MSQAVKPGIVHLGITDFHRGHQAHFINEILGSNEAAMVQMVPARNGCWKMLGY
jgi:mannitol-1-phosphate/altronate dehydrogenase